MIRYDSALEQVFVSEDIDRFIRNGFGHYRHYSNVLAYVIHAIGTGMTAYQVFLLMKAVYDGYKVALDEGSTIEDIKEDTTEEGR